MSYVGIAQTERVARPGAEQLAEGEPGLTLERSAFACHGEQGRGDLPGRDAPDVQSDAGGGHATSAGVPPVMRTSSSKVVGKTVRGCPAAAHTTSCSARSTSTSVRISEAWPTGATPPIAMPVAAADELGVGAADLRDPEEGGDLGSVDPVAARGQDEQWLAVGREDERVGDGGHGAVELGGGGRCSGGVLGKDHRRPGRTRGGQGVLDPADGRVGEDLGRIALGAHGSEASWAPS